jgi:radical SAM enzyme (TIGR01210 family)
MIIRQIDHFFALPDVMDRREKIVRVIISNQGSVLDEETFSSVALMHLIAKLNTMLPNMAVLSLETRPEYVDMAELEFLARGLREGQTPTTLELAVGYEAHDERIRNHMLRKGLNLAHFEAFLKKVAGIGAPMMVKTYLMLKPVVGMTDEEAVQDVINAMRYLHEVSQTYKVPISIHLNPTYAARGTPLAAALLRGEYKPPRLLDVARAVLAVQDLNMPIYIGLYDEGLALTQDEHGEPVDGTFLRLEDEELRQAMEDFNRTQNYQTLMQHVESAQRVVATA